MKTNIKRVQMIQSSMVESARSCFVESQLDDVRCIIRITVEFFDFVQNTDLDKANDFALRYCVESVFSGIDSFASACAAYRVLVGATDSSLQWNNVSMISLKEQFISMFHEFDQETHFENKCRLLLDLFKMQIVFAGMLYD
ncbi:MAG: hypothetical protein ABSE16_20475 [Verrucomicrobiota bacterium]|jgi:hypothetical protein